MPYHSNWKMSETHPAVWQMTAIIDHVKPVARGGPDANTNMIATSMLRNSAKSNWTIKELEWEIQPPVDCREWGGMMSWYVDAVAADPSLRKHGFIRQWSHRGQERGRGSAFFEPEVD